MNPNTGTAIVLDDEDNILYIVALNGTITRSYPAPLGWVWTAGALDRQNNFIVGLAVEINSTSLTQYSVGKGLLMKLSTVNFTVIFNVTTDNYAAYDGAVVDSNNRIYLLDYTFNQIRIYDGNTGNYLGSIRSGFSPQFMSVDKNGDVFICDKISGDVLLLNSDGSTKQTFSLSNTNDGRTACSDITVNPSGSLLAVLNGYGNVVVNGSFDGNTVTTFNTATGNIVGSFITNPSIGIDTNLFAIAMDSQNNIYYVFESNPSNVYVVNYQSGAIVRTIPTRTTGPVLYGLYLDLNDQLWLTYVNYASLNPATSTVATATVDLYAAHSTSLVNTYTINEPFNSTYQLVSYTVSADTNGMMYYVVGSPASNPATYWIGATNPSGGTTYTVWSNTVTFSFPTNVIAVDGNGYIYSNDREQGQILKIIGIDVPYNGNAAMTGYASISSLSILLCSLLLSMIAFML